MASQVLANVMNSMNPGQIWLKKLDTFFKTKASAIETLNGAHGCRERWLQGELFLSDPEHVRIDFAVLYNKPQMDRDPLKPKINLKTGIPRTTPMKADFEASQSKNFEAPDVVAEIKIVGTGGAHKFWDGKRWSAKEDLKRLQQANFPKETLRLLIVVVVDEPGKKDKRAKDLREKALYGELPAIERKGIGPENGNVKVRVWEVEPASTRMSGNELTEKSPARWG